MPRCNGYVLYSQHEKTACEPNCVYRKRCKKPESSSSAYCTCHTDQAVLVGAIVSVKKNTIYPDPFPICLDDISRSNAIALKCCPQIDLMNDEASESDVNNRKKKCVRYRFHKNCLEGWL